MLEVRLLGKFEVKHKKKPLLFPRARHNPYLLI